MDSNFVPINEWIVIEEEEPMTITASGIHIPKVVSAKQEIKKCKVIAISEDVYRICAEEGRELQYSVGDTVIHHSKIGLRVDTSNDKDRRYLLRYDTIIAVCLPKEEEESNG